MIDNETKGGIFPGKVIIVENARYVEFSASKHKGELYVEFTLFESNVPVQRGARAPSAGTGC
jgi:hypothetical protein